MMTDHRITALKAQKRNPNRVSIYLDGDFAFGMARIVAAWLSVGQIISDEKIAALRIQDAREAAFQSALKALSYRPRSRAEVLRKLTEQGFDLETIEAAMNRLEQGGYVQDNQFAQAWVENRSAFRPRSQRMLAMELRQKGVTEEIIRQTLADTSDEEMATDSARRYCRRLEGLDWPEFRQKMTAYLARRGFSYPTAAEAAQKVWYERTAPANTMDYEEPGK